MMQMGARISKRTTMMITTESQIISITVLQES